MLENYLYGPKCRNTHMKHHTQIFQNFLRCPFRSDTGTSSGMFTSQRKIIEVCVTRIPTRSTPSYQLRTEQDTPWILSLQGFWFPALIVIKHLITWNVFWYYTYVFTKHTHKVLQKLLNTPLQSQRSVKENLRRGRGKFHIKIPCGWKRFHMRLNRELACPEQSPVLISLPRRPQPAVATIPNQSNARQVHKGRLNTAL